jgi:lipid II:glycine glycyltransferase (peptidoglycan interpeptide bridge formation enzyme)
MKPASDEQMKQWDELVAVNPDAGNVLQLKAFADTKERHGWTPKYFILGKTALLVLSRQIPRLGEFWYVPKGPGVADRTGLKAFAGMARDLPGPKPFAIRIDPEILATAASLKQLEGYGYVTSPRNIQYNVSTVVVRLDQAEDVVLGSFKQKTRYNVRLAAKKGVTVEAVATDQTAIDTMYHLTEVTTRRAGVYLRDKQYFSDFWKLHADSGHGQMFFAKYEGQILAGAFVTYVGHKALYKDGGSVREHPEVQAPYALQWEVMRWLMQHGVTEYDLHGTPPADRIEDPTHPLAGLARFKTGFQPEVTEYIGTFDLPLDEGRYQIWRRIGERLAVAYEYRATGRLFY